MEFKYIFSINYNNFMLTEKYESKYSYQYYGNRYINSLDLNAGISN